MIDDLSRHLIESSIACGRKRTSRQTGFLHYINQAEDGEAHLAIPLAENFLFAYALMRRCTADQVLEGKALVDKLLCFQIESGNFPVYLHDYPRALDRFLGAHLLPSFYWILKGFGSVLGHETRQKLEGAAKKLLSFCLETEKAKEAPYQIAVKIATSALAFGRLFENADLVAIGEQKLKNLENPSDFISWCIPQQIGEILIGLQMVYPSIASSSWNSFWHHINTVWHKPSLSYIGPSYREAFKGYESEMTLYDLYMGYFTGLFSKRALEDNIVQLYGALIQPSEDRLEQSSYPFTIENENYRVYQSEAFAYSIIKKKEPFQPMLDRYCHPFKMVWGNTLHSNSFVMQQGNIPQIDFQALDGKIELFCMLGPPIHVEDREENREVSFYVDAFEASDVNVDGNRSSTFQLGESVRLKAGGLNLSLSFQLKEGDGHFFGHIMRGNRPSQNFLKGIHRYEAFDWQVFLRTLRRSSPCSIEVKIEAWPC